MKRRPLVVVPYTRPYTRIVRFKNGRANLSKTFAGMDKGQTILVRMASRTDRSLVKCAANNARVRIRINEHPSIDTIQVTSLGPQRERVMSEATPGHVRYFKPRHFVPQRPSSQQKPQRKPRHSPPLTNPQPSNLPDIFS
jgi:hypothetical protein